MTQLPVPSAANLTSLCTGCRLSAAASKTWLPACIHPPKNSAEPQLSVSDARRAETYPGPMYRRPTAKPACRLPLLLLPGRRHSAGRMGWMAREDMLFDSTARVFSGKLNGLLRRLPAAASAACAGVCAVICIVVCAGVCAIPVGDGGCIGQKRLQVAMGICLTGAEV